MGFKYSYDQEDILRAIKVINIIAHNVHDGKQDGYTQWGAKQDLYRLKWHIDSVLKKCPEFSEEQNWLREQEKKQLISILKDEV